ncbi:MAG: PadR family transcriptional regulator [Gemmatimonadetes bacterium]|nr:PadR family transcriptional regulator [Gemmatimonadota bacterium]
MSRDSLSIRPGTVNFLALGAVARGGRMHGFEILKWIQDSSDGELLVEEGALYPALHKLEKRRWLTSQWSVSPKGRRAKYYEITAAGRASLSEQSRDWERFVAAVGRVVVLADES